MTPAPMTLAAEGLHHAYRRGTFALDVPALDVPASSVLALLGPSGSGKSTLLEILGLLQRPDAGRVLLDGRVVTDEDRDARLLMSAVFQRPYLFKGTVAANVAYGLVARGVPAAQRTPRVVETLEHVGLGGFEGRSALALSGGEAQRVSLARALVVEPRVLLLDEPLASLDPLLKRRLAHDFASILRSAGVTVVYVTHDQDEALVVADRVAIMNAGRIAAFGAADDVTGLPPDEWAAAFLGVEQAVRGSVVAVRDGLADVLIGTARIAVAGEPPLGAELLVAVRPEDVFLFEGDVDLPLTTARNRLHASVVSVLPVGATNRVVLDAEGLRLAASVSRAATTELGIVPGAAVLAVFKASAVRWRRATSAEGAGEPTLGSIDIPADREA
jgi:molybdopterin-binding protein